MNIFSRKYITLFHFWRGLLWIGAVSVLLWIFFQNLVPSGILVLEHTKGSPISPISDLHPEKRLIELPEDGDAQRVYVDPVYFDAKVPREFDTVTVDITWQNQSQPIVELGARKVRGAWGFVMQSLQNRFIDDVLYADTSPWDCNQYEGVLFCQKNNRYADLASFFTNPPTQGIATYHYTLPEGITADSMNVYTDLSEYNYVLASYTSPESLGNDWYTRRVTFNWQDFALHINEISFLLSAPDLHKGNGQIVVGDIVITLQRDPLDWEGLLSYIKNQFKRLTT